METAAGKYNIEGRGQPRGEDNSGEGTAESSRGRQQRKDGSREVGQLTWWDNRGHETTAGMRQSRGGENNGKRTAELDGRGQQREGDNNGRGIRVKWAAEWSRQQRGRTAEGTGHQRAGDINEKETGERRRQQCGGRRR